MDDVVNLFIDIFLSFWFLVIAIIAVKLAWRIYRTPPKEKP